MNAWDSAWKSGWNLPESGSGSSALLPAVNSFIISNGMSLRDYDPSTLNGDGGGAAWRGILITKVPHGRTHTKISLFIGAVNDGYDPDTYRVAIAQGGWTIEPSSWTEMTYPGGLSSYTPPRPSAYGKITGAWLQTNLTPVGFDTPVSWSVAGAGTGRWTAGSNPIAASWNSTTLAYNQYMDISGTLTGPWTSNYGDVSMGFLAWEFTVSGDPLYNVAVVGDSTYNGTRPLGSAHATCTEGVFHYASISELENGMRWWCSCWGNGAYSMDDYLARGVSILPLLSGRAQIILVQAWTYNQSPDSVEGAQAQQAQLLAFKATAEEYGYKVIFCILNPQGEFRISSGWNAGYDEQVAWVAEQGGINVASSISDGGRDFNASYAEDKVHVNEAGIIHQAPFLSAAITAQLQTLGAF